MRCFSTTTDSGMNTAPRPPSRPSHFRSTNAQHHAPTVPRATLAISPAATGSRVLHHSHHQVNGGQDAICRHSSGTHRSCRLFTGPSTSAIHGRQLVEEGAHG